MAVQDAEECQEDDVENDPDMKQLVSPVNPVCPPSLTPYTVDL